MKELELKSKLAEMELCLSALWSMLEAIHDAMQGEDNDLKTYVYAVYGTANQAYSLKEELGQIVEQLETEEHKED